MESQLIGQLFRKLLDALRIKRVRPKLKPRIRAESRLKQAFAVIVDGLRIRGEIFLPESAPLSSLSGVKDNLPTGFQAAVPRGLRETLDTLHWLMILPRFGIISVIFNFRGCGDSDGNFEMTGWVRDLELVLDRIINTPYVDPTRVMLLGFSGGGTGGHKSSRRFTGCLQPGRRGHSVGFWDLRQGPG